MDTVFTWTIGYDNKVKNRRRQGPRTRVHYSVYSWHRAFVNAATMFGMSQDEIAALCGYYQLHNTLDEEKTERAIMKFEKALDEFVIPSYYRGLQGGDVDLNVSHEIYGSNDKNSISTHIYSPSELDNFTKQMQSSQNNWLSSQLSKNLPSQCETNIIVYPVQFDLHRTNPNEDFSVNLGVIPSSDRMFSIYVYYPKN